jgi:hypothetical protein
MAWQILLATSSDAIELKISQDLTRVQTSKCSALDVVAGDI